MMLTAESGKHPVCVGVRPMASVAGHPTVGLPGPNAQALVACKQSGLFATFIDLSCTSPLSQLPVGVASAQCLTTAPAHRLYIAGLSNRYVYIWNARALIVPRSCTGITDLQRRHCLPNHERNIKTLLHVAGTACCPETRLQLQVQKELDASFKSA